jgi:hypothetical protein
MHAYSRLEGEPNLVPQSEEMQNEAIEVGMVIQSHVQPHEY